MSHLLKFITWWLFAGTSLSLPAAELRQAHGEPSSGDRIKWNQGVILKKLELGGETDVQLDEAGKVLKLRLIGRNAADTAVRLACDLDSLQSLAIQGPAPSHAFTANCISSLTALTNLSNLELLCMGKLEPGIFEEICRLRQLQTLTLGFSFPERSEYTSMTNLTNLVKLNVSYCTNFGSAEVHFLTNLVKLRSLELTLDGFSHKDTNVVGELLYLTNNVVVIREP